MTTKTATAAKPEPTPPSERERNMELWNRLFHTDPSATKAFKRAGGFSGTAIKPFWCIKRATEEFGPVGQGWGWTEHEHMTFVNTDGRAVWFSSVSVWYKAGAETYETGRQWGATELVAKRSSGDFLDEEAAKKAVTDGITKCLSYLGLAGDVHMGLFDDSKYVNEQKGREEREGQGVKIAPEAVTLWRDTTVASAKACKTSEDLQPAVGGREGELEALRQQRGRGDEGRGQLRQEPGRAPRRRAQAGCRRRGDAT